MAPYRSPSSYMGYARPAPSFQLADFARILWDRRWLIAIVAGAVVAAAVLVTAMMPDRFTSSAVVMLDQRKNNVTELSAVLSQLPADPATLQNQIQILNSRELASEVITRLELYNDPEFNPVLVAPGPSSMFKLSFWFPKSAATTDIAVIHDKILDNFLQSVSAEGNGLSTAITIYATSRDAKKSQAIANAMAQAYVDDQINARRDAVTGTSQWLDQRTNELAQQLMQQQQAVQQYKAQHGLNDSAPGNSLVDQQMAAINAQIVQARSDLAQKQAAADRVGSSAAAGNAADVSQVVASPVVIQLRQQQAELIRQEADLASKYGPLHPKLVAVQAQRRDLDAKIAQEVTRVAGSMDNDVAASAAHLRSLQASLGGVERQAHSDNLARVELQALQSNADSTKTQYEAFVGRLRSTQNQDISTTPESRIISPALLPTNPSEPKRGMIVGASLPLGLLLGILAALLSERFGFLRPAAARIPSRTPLGAPTIIVPPRKVRKAAKALPPVWNGPPILAELANAERMGAAAYVVDYPGSRYAQAMATLVAQLESHESGASVVAVTAAAPGESKSAIAVSLARAAAQMGKKTVLIDCDPGQMAVKAMEAPAKAGLYEVLTGAAPLSEALAKDARTGAYALAMTRRPPKLTTMFTSAAMTKLIQILKEGTDLVVLDCSRAGAGPEAGMLAKLCDATLLVSRKDGLAKSALTNSVAVLSGGAPVAIIATK